MHKRPGVHAHAARALRFRGPAVLATTRAAARVPHRGGEYRANTARGDGTGAWGAAWTAPTAQRAARGTFAPSVRKGLVAQGVPEGTQGGAQKAVCNAVLEVVKGAPHGTQGGTRGYSRKFIPDGATAGTTVVGASVGERAGVSVGAGVGVGVTAQTHTRRWTARQNAGSPSAPRCSVLRAPAVTCHTQTYSPPPQESLSTN